MIHRWHQVRRQLVQAWKRLSPAALHRRLTTRTDRRKVLRLVLPDGRIWTGGERELARRVLDNSRLEAARPRRLSRSGIRRRLRMLTLQDRGNAALVAEAFGFALLRDNLDENRIASSRNVPEPRPGCLTRMLP